MKPTEDLLREATSGHQPAFDELMERYMPGLHAFIRLRSGKLIRDKESPSDILQSVLREVLEKADQFQYGGEAGFKHWLFTTALRKLSNKQDYYRAEKRDALREHRPMFNQTASSDILACYGTFVGPSQHAIAEEELARVERAFEKLPEHYREVIVLTRICGLSREEAGKEMGRSEMAVRSLLSRALAQLAEHLG